MTHDYGTPVNAQFEQIHSRLNIVIQQLNKTKGANDEDRKALIGAVGKLINIRNRLFGTGSGVTGKEFGGSEIK